MIRNRIAELLQAREESRYRFWKKTGIARKVAYAMADDPLYSITTKNLDAICEAYGVEVADVIEHIPNEQGEEPLKKIAA